MDDLVQRLCVGDQEVEVSIRPETTAVAFKECIDRGYVHIRFTGTRGGTELGVTLDRDATDLRNASFEDASGSVDLVGRLTLNAVKVQCLAHIEVASLKGYGKLVPQMN
jgi:hypothetical protein